MKSNPIARVLRSGTFNKPQTVKLKTLYNRKNKSWKDQ